MFGLVAMRAKMIVLEGKKIDSPDLVSLADYQVTLR